MTKDLLKGPAGGPPLGAGGHHGDIARPPTVRTPRPRRDLGFPSERLRSP